MTDETPLTVTTQEFADRLGVSYAEAMGFLKVLTKKNIVQDGGKRKGNGVKPSQLYLVPRKVALEI